MGSTWKGTKKVFILRSRLQYTKWISLRSTTMVAVDDWSCENENFIRSR